MTDRDRLAADLMIPYPDTPEAADCALCGEPVRTESVREFADDLIALGWTRPGTEEFVESIGLSCCPHTEPAALREHVENEGSCVVCREYIAHTDEGYRLVAWPCPTVRAATLDEERLARALNSLAIPDEWLLRDRTPFAAAIAKAYREDTDATD